MTREEKIEKRKARSYRRRKARMERYISRINMAREVGDDVPLYCVQNGYVSGSWPDPNSPTGYSQKCSYYGICQSPCNGDC
jgi:hypothetical protein